MRVTDGAVRVGTREGSLFRVSVERGGVPGLQSEKYENNGKFRRPKTEKTHTHKLKK